MNSLTYLRVKKNEMHTQVLYEMLENRKFNISHNSLPTFDCHKNFVYNHPYRFWYLVMHDDIFIGNFYILSNNSVGIYIFFKPKVFIPIVIRHILHNFKPLKAVKSVREAVFDFNCSPKNKEFIYILNKMGAKISQFTFVF